MSRSKQRAEEFVRHVLVKDLKQSVSDRTVREVAKQVLAVTAPVLAHIQRLNSEPQAEEARAA
jgi:hypothetical protein